MKIRKGQYEVEGTPVEVAELLQHLDRGPALSPYMKFLPQDKKLTLNDIWGIGDEPLRDYVRKNHWAGPGAAAEFFFGRTVYSTGDDRPLYHALYRRIGDARRYWDTKEPGWNVSPSKPLPPRFRGREDESSDS